MLPLFIHILFIKAAECEWWEASLRHQDNVNKRSIVNR